MKWEQEHVARYPPLGRHFIAPEVYVLVPAIRVLHRGGGFCERRRVEDDVVVFFLFRLCHLRQQLEYVRAKVFHPVFKPVQRRVFLHLLDCKSGNIDSCHLFRSGEGTVQRESSRVGEAVENHPSLRELCGGLAVVLLVEEIAGFRPSM